MTLYNRKTENHIVKKTEIEKINLVLPLNKSKEKEHNTLEFVPYILILLALLFSLFSFCIRVNRGTRNIIKN